MPSTELEIVAFVCKCFVPVAAGRCMTQLLSIYGSGFPIWPPSEIHPAAPWDEGHATPSGDGKESASTASTAISLEKAHIGRLVSP